MSPRALIVGLSGPRLEREERSWLAAVAPWGVILFARNIEAPDQLRGLVDAIRDALGRPAPVLIDQEGGRVQRLRAPHWRDWPSVAVQMARVTPAQAARAMWLRGRLIAADLGRVGIDVNCAPLLDVAGPETHPFLADRCAGEDPGIVACMGRALADGLMAGGVLPVIKHLPGHGRAWQDSHRDLPRITAPLEDLSRRDFPPFAALSELPLGMTGHVCLEAVDPDAPATLSAAAITLIRERIGFRGLLMTDDISMGALSGPVGDRARAALRAGCDLILHCNGDLAEMAALAEVVPVLDGAAAGRATRAEAARRTATLADEAALLAEYGALLEGRRLGP